MIECGYCNKWVSESFMGYGWRVNKDCSRNYSSKSTMTIKYCNCNLKNIDYYEKIADKETLRNLKTKLSEDEINKWTDADKIVIYIAGTIGMIINTLITQTKILKPVDKYISNKLKSKKIKNFKNLFDNYSNSFRKGDSAPIDFQDFEMYGPKSIHAQYSAGHDPLRFTEGILQIISGNYKGVDKFGNIQQSIFGTPVPDIFQAVISYISHMVSDFCNVLSLPYPGSTFLMEWGNDKVRKDLSNAFRSQLYNSRVFIYQNLEILLMNIIIYGYAIYDNYLKKHEINLFIGNEYKYQSMLLASYAMPCALNIAITGTKILITKNPHELFRLNYTTIFNTLKLSIKMLIWKLKK